MEERKVSPLHDLDAFSVERHSTPVLQAVIHVPQSIYGLGPSKFACHYRAEWSKLHTDITSEAEPDLSLHRNVATIKLVRNPLIDLKEPLSTLPSAEKIHQIFKAAKLNTDYTVSPHVRYLTLPSTERFQDEDNKDKPSARYHSEQNIFDVLSRENTEQGIREDKLDAKLLITADVLWERITNKGEYLVKHIYTEREPCTFHNYEDPCSGLIAQLSRVQFGKYQIPIEVYYTNPYVDNKSKSITQNQLRQGKIYALSKNPQILQERIDQLSKNIYLGKKIIFNNFTTHEEMNNINEEIKSQSRELLLLKEIQKIRNDRDLLFNEWKTEIKMNLKIEDPDYSQRLNYLKEFVWKQGELFDKLDALQKDIDIKNKKLSQLESDYAELNKSQSKTPTILVDQKAKYDEETTKHLEKLGKLKIEYKQLMYNTFILLNTNYSKVSALVNDCQKSLGELNLLMQRLKIGEVKHQDIDYSLNKIKIHLDKATENFEIQHNEEKMRLEEQSRVEKRKYSEIEDPRSVIPQIKSSSKQKKDLIEPANGFQSSLDEYREIINEKGLTKEDDRALFNTIENLEKIIKEMKGKNNASDLEYNRLMNSAESYIKVIKMKLDEPSKKQRLNM